MHPCCPDAPCPSYPDVSIRSGVTEVTLERFCACSNLRFRSSASRGLRYASCCTAVSYVL
jgi:hypothetical protein